MEQFNTQKEIIQWGYVDFKTEQPHPHIDRASYEAGAKYAFDFAMQEFRTLIVEHYGIDDPLYEDVIEDLIHKFEHQLGYEKYKQKR